MDEAKIEELRATHGKLLQANTPKGLMLFKKPSKFVWQRFTNLVSRDSADKHDVIVQLACGCVVHPTEKEARAIFEEYPALPASLSEGLAKLAGAEGGEGFEVKAL